MMVNCVIIVVLSAFVILTKAVEILYDTPVSNHGARVRFIIYCKDIRNFVKIIDPKEIGGVKSETYMKINCQGKQPLLITESGFPIAESDTIAKYLLRKYSSCEPSFGPDSIMNEVLCNQIVRFHDIYISPIQGSMYKAKGTPFSNFRTNRKEALNELKKQLININNLIYTFHKCHNIPNTRFICGETITLADATLFPTLVMLDYIMPKICDNTDFHFKTPHIQEWKKSFLTNCPQASIISDKISTVLKEWKANGRLHQIKQELDESNYNELSTIT